MRKRRPVSLSELAEVADRPRHLENRFSHLGEAGLGSSRFQDGDASIRTPSAVGLRAFAAPFQRAEAGTTSDWSPR